MTARDDLRDAKGPNETWLAAELSITRWWALPTARRDHEEWHRRAALRRARQDRLDAALTTPAE